MGWQWPWGRVQERSISVSDPILAAYFGLGPHSYSGVSVTEQSALGISAVYRAVALISSTLASLPMRSLKRDDAGTKIRVNSFLDDPGGSSGLTPFEWRELVLVHLLLHGNCFLLHEYNNGGAIHGLFPIHPLAVTVDRPRELDHKPEYVIHLNDGTQRRYVSADVTHIPALGTDGLMGLSPITVARNSLGAAIAGDRAAARMFASGAMLTGMVTAEEDVTEEDGKRIKEGLDAKVAGYENAGEIAFVNRKLKFTPWQMSMEDAQFLETRQFSVEEVARWYGLPSFALNLEQKNTSWGSGIESLQRGLARTTLVPWAKRVEARLSRLVHPSGKFVEFDFTGLERGTPSDEIRLLLVQVLGGLISINEARGIRNLPPVEGGDELVKPDPTTTAPLLGGLLAGGG